MSDLVLKNTTAAIVHERILDKLNPVENAIVEDATPSENNPKVEDMTSAQMMRLISAITLKASVRLGSKPKDQSEREAISMEINEILLEEFPLLTANEIMRALKNGLNGRFVKPGDPVFFSPSNFVQWVKTDLESVKLPAMKRFLQLKQQTFETPVVPGEQQAEILFNHFKFALDSVSKGGIFDDMGNAVFNFLQAFGSIGLGDVTEEDWTKILEKATKSLESDAKKTGKFSDLKQVMAEMIVIKEDGFYSDRIVSLAKRMFIQERLKKIASWQPDDITDFMEQIQLMIEEMFGAKPVKESIMPPPTPVINLIPIRRK